MHRRCDDAGRWRPDRRDGANEDVAAQYVPSLVVQNVRELDSFGGSPRSSGDALEVHRATRDVDRIDAHSNVGSGLHAVRRDS